MGAALVLGGIAFTVCLASGAGRGSILRAGFILDAAVWIGILIAGTALLIYGADTAGKKRKIAGVFQWSAFVLYGLAIISLLFGGIRVHFISVSPPKGYGNICAPIAIWCRFAPSGAIFCILSTIP